LEIFFFFSFPRLPDFRGTTVRKSNAITPDRADTSLINADHLVERVIERVEKGERVERVERVEGLRD
jgi:hypothetical protein